MSNCTHVTDLLGASVDARLEADDEQLVRDHLRGCRQCSEIAAALADIGEALAPLAGLEPSDRLVDEVCSSPCRRWLGLLFQAVDREITEPNLQRLLTHLESCDSCRQAWNDLSLIHQVGDALVPPPHLVHRCVAARVAGTRQPLLGRRLATAAAYLLAVLTSLAVGNPTTATTPIAAVGEVAAAVSAEVREVAEHGRGEVRVMVWRAWQWSSDRVDDARGLIHELTDRETDETDTDVADDTEQGES